ncbi:uncharacterized protein LOC108697634 isoform X2 [Xenopus laevis]|nr:uncharacterized protein LOC108697634 isoform X2 [Xenopus laevis]XP_041427360.1 uncharacterized protein LOC108697634 isoform X2 [Xenopus laevis]XP_041427361.1 uncharacterized protein LOC108697634 isoform X2 [Xenopus laevis]
MSEDRAAKLKLKRRKGSAAQEPQASEISRHPPAASSVSAKRSSDMSFFCTEQRIFKWAPCTDGNRKVEQGLQGVVTEVARASGNLSNARKITGGSWLSDINLTATEQTWKEVLNAAFTDLQNVGWDGVPCLPAFDSKVADKGQNGMAEPEIFKIGEQRFEWFPFPTDSPQHITDQRDTMQERHTERTNSAEEQKGSQLSTDIVIAPETEETNAQVKERFIFNVPLVQAKHRPNNSAEHKPHTGHTHSAPKLAISERSHLSQAPEGAEKRHQENIQTNDIVMQDLEEDIRPCSSRSQEPRESAKTSSGNAGSLESCPMCLMQFSKRLSQLDIDSHLAQCLSETTVDMMW